MDAREELLSRMDKVEMTVLITFLKNLTPIYGGSQNKLAIYGVVIKINVCYNSL